MEIVFGYSTQDSVKNWLRRNCQVTCKHFPPVFSSRRALLSALISPNPDSKDECTKWINPILVYTQDHRDRQAAMLLALNDVFLIGRPSWEKKYWWKYIVDAVEVGRGIKESFGSESKQLAWHYLCRYEQEIASFAFCYWKYIRGSINSSILCFAKHLFVYCEIHIPFFLIDTVQEPGSSHLCVIVF